MRAGDIMEIAYKKAFSEVLYLIYQTDDFLKSKIPKSFINFMTENCDTEYKATNISIEKPDTLLQETKTILSLIYRCYFTDNKKESNEIYIDNLDCNVEIKVEEKIIPEDYAIVVQNKSNGIFRKIYNFIQRIFKFGGK